VLGLTLTRDLTAVFKGLFAGDFAGDVTALDAALLADAADFTALVLRVTRVSAGVIINDSK